MYRVYRIYYILNMVFTLYIVYVLYIVYSLNIIYNLYREIPYTFFLLEFLIFFKKKDFCHIFYLIHGV